MACDTVSLGEQLSTFRKIVVYRHVTRRRPAVEPSYRRGVLTGLLAGHTASHECVPGFYPGVKWPEREVNHSLPFNTKVRNELSCVATPQYAFMEYFNFFTSLCHSLNIALTKCHNLEDQSYSRSVIT